MRPTISTLLLFACAAAASAQSPAASHPASPPAIAWGPAPAVFPAGAQMAVLEGDPASTSLFTVRLRLPDGYKIAPHTHPTDENVTVISGTFRVGMGTTFDSKGMMSLPPGGFVTAPANHAHFAIAQGATIVQVHAMGPFALTYVNPADNPQSSASR
jgi:quercetin dioxygenase-like cupin family protein